MNINLPIGTKGRFKLIKHTGHRLNELGEVVEWGQVLDETPFFDNVFTYFGSAVLLGPGTNTVSIQLSSSSAPPTLDGYGPEVVGTIKRISTTLVSSATDRRTDPDENGMLWWRTTYRFSFPLVEDGAVMEFRQAAAVVDTSSAVNGVSQGPVSIAMLQGPDGSDASLRLDTAQEAVDVVWEFTEYVPAESTGDLVVNIVDGMNANLGSSTHGWLIRPANFDNASVSEMGWLPTSGRSFPRTTVGSVKVGVGTIGFADTQPTFDESFGPTITNLRLGMTSRHISATLSFDDTTSEEVIDCAQFTLNHTEWQLAFDPPIPKLNRHQMKITLALTTGDRDRLVAARALLAEGDLS